MWRCRVDGFCGLLERAGAPLDSHACRAILEVMDVLAVDDVETGRGTPPAEKLKQALELSEAGIAFAAVAVHLTAAARRFALVGGLAVSVRAEVRFTRDVDLAVAVHDDADAESLVYALKLQGYAAIASVEHEARGRLATLRLRSVEGVKVDLLFASSGIEHETVERASMIRLPSIGEVPVARAEELLSLKVLSMTDERLQDRIDARNLLRMNDNLDLDQVRDNLRLIAERGYARGQDLLVLSPLGGPIKPSCC